MMISSVKNLLKRIGRFIKRRWLLLLILVVLLAGGGFFAYQRTQSNQETLTYVQPEYRDLTKTLEVSGIVDANEKANMRFAVGGKIVYIGAKEGDTVKKGATIATIDQRQLQKQLQQDLNNFTQQRLTRDETLDGLNGAPPLSDDEFTLNMSQLDLNNAALAVEIRDIAIRESRLTAPFAGVLVASPVTVPGVNVAANEAFELINPTTLVFKVAVDETDIGLVKVGDEATITLDAYPDDPIEGVSVSAIGYKSQQTSSSTVYIVTIPMPASSDILNRYRLGMSGDATIVIEQKSNVLSIPIDATRQRDDKVYVDVKDGENGKVEREIQIGLETDDYVEVVSGLSVNDEVVLPEGVTAN